MLKSFLSSIKGKEFLVLAHSGADVDAIASAGALYFAFGGKFRISIGVPEHINLNAKALAESLSIPYSINPENIADFDGIIIVDLNSFQMLGSLKEQLRNFKKPILLIDHHEKSADKIAGRKNTIIRDDAVSTTEIIYDLFSDEGIPINSEAAQCIASGIVTDSCGFLVADSETFRTMADCMEKSGKRYSEILSLFQLKADISEKIAMLKAARRCRIYGAFGRIIVSTDVGAFEADSATALVRLGADIAFVGGAKKGKIMLSGRASGEFIKETGFELAKDIFWPLEKEFGGSGGGHSGAAGFNTEGGDIQKIMKGCIDLSFKFLENRFPGKKDSLKEY